MRVLKYPHTDALIVVANILGNEVHMVLIDDESSVDIIFIDAFDRIGLQ